MRRILSGGVALLALTAGVVVPRAGAAAPDPGPEVADPQVLSVLSNDAFAELNRPGSGVRLSYTGVDSKTNRVEIGVIGLTPGLIRQLEQRYGADRVRVVPAQPFRHTMLKIRKSSSALNSLPAPPGVTPQDNVGVCSNTGVYCAPTRGGVYLQQDVGDGVHVYVCSSTIVGTSRAGSNATLTAGHCFPRAGVPVLYGSWILFPPPVRAAGGQLGVPGDRLFGGTSDHLVIPWSNPSGWFGSDFPNNCIFIPGVDCQRMNFNAGTGDMPIGTEVTQRGDTTGRTSGTIVLNSANANVGGVPLTDVVITSACSLPGDSGGAAFVRDRLVGTISGGNFINEDPPRCNPSPRSVIAKATRAFSNLGFSSRLRP